MKFTRADLERQQVWIYLGAIGLGLLLGGLAPQLGAWLEGLLWPILVLLLYTTFVQVPLLHLREALRDQRFAGAVLLGNFLILPLLVWLLSLSLPPDPALRLGVLLVLLVPCTDWFITFSQLGGGDVARAITISPVKLMLQLLLLPFYLWLMSGSEVQVLLLPTTVWPALLIVLIPLGLAALSERWMEAEPTRLIWRERLAWGPVPLLALVVGLIAASQVGTIIALPMLLPMVLPIYVLFLILAALIARSLSHLFKLPTNHGRTLAFSMGTRNSFVVLPFALTLPAGWEAVAVVIVVQALVELIGMTVYLWWVPQRLFRV